MLSLLLLVEPSFFPRLWAVSFLLLDFRIRYLDYCVVETAVGGQKCIEYLKKHNLGRTSFIVLEQIRDRYERALGQPFHVPEQAQRLFDLVEPADERMRCAFYFALRNTLVTSDLDTAVGFAYEGNKPMHRVVTRGGDLIDTTGTLSGGGKTVRRGGMLFTGSAGPTSFAPRSAHMAARTSANSCRSSANCLSGMSTSRTRWSCSMGRPARGGGLGRKGKSRRRKQF